ncbi:hypothetical protein H2200_001323 [Cladophialophora chaetospira]|uniref:Heterokaryon incompatibility domain-containing protein n=1 Tax=Cladophialophora chaetospira TaxID=386627 RepID=A0AA39CNY7_9EURO|nr:hypothetical protein H2200_001323 [Cladophialophora chaetospira]
MIFNSLINAGFTNKIRVWWKEIRGIDDPQTSPYFCSLCCGMLTKQRHYFPRGAILLGTAQDIEKRLADASCALCEVIISFIRGLPDFEKISATGTTLRLLQLRGFWTVQRGSWIRLGLSAGQTRVGEILHCTLRDDWPVRGHELGNLRSLSERSQMVFDMIHAWIEECENFHGARCHHAPAPRQDDESRGLILIDVIEGCLVPAHSSARYLTLSYRWGASRDSSTLAVTSKNFEQLKVAGSLAPKDSRIPVAIRDAMELVRKLGERYLWVDVLCIFQDDEATMKRQIDQMNLIFDRYKKLYRESPNLDSIAPQTLYETRGWTYQERILSTRCLVLTEREVFYFYEKGSIRETWNSYPLEQVDPFADFPSTESTRESTSSEELTEESEPRVEPELGELESSDEDFPVEVSSRNSCPAATEASPASRQPEVISEMFQYHDQSSMITNRLRVYENLRVSADLTAPPQNQSIQILLDSYNHSVGEYTQRNLTYSSDMIRAFAGITEKISVLAGTSFICGLPARVFDAALLWTPLNSVYNNDRPSSTRVEPEKLDYPSWSWASGVGPVSFLVPKGWGTHREDVSPTLSSTPSFTEESMLKVAHRDDDARYIQFLKTAAVKAVLRMNLRHGERASSSS